MKKNKYTKGFTLIELMVVISIIGFLSSVIIVSLKEARDKAEHQAFRSSVEQFIKAVELYKNDKGLYPGEINKSFGTLGFGFYSHALYPDVPVTQYHLSGNSSGFDSYDDYSVALNPYIKELPVPKNTVGNRFYYASSNSDPRFTKCFGDSNQSPYVIHAKIMGSPVFDDWSYAQLPSGLVNVGLRCFSLK